MKNAPNWVIVVCSTVVFITVVAAFTLMAVLKVDSGEFRSFLNTVLNVATVVLSGGAFLAAGSSAKSAAKAEEQTNGQMKSTIHAAVQDAMNGKEDNDNGRSTV